MLQVCVEKCPSHHFSYYALESQEALVALEVYTFEEGRDLLVCTTDKLKRSLKTFKDVEDAVDRQECTAYVVKSQPGTNIIDQNQKHCNDELHSLFLFEWSVAVFPAS